MHASLPRAALAALLSAVAGCAGPLATAPPAVSGQATIDGTVLAVDTAPWAYDGNAVVTLATDAGSVRVQLPARWNLCRAQPLDDLQTLKAGDRVQAVGALTAPDELVVCAQPEDRLRKLD